MSNLKNLIRQFLEHLEIEKNRSPKTIENYNHYLSRFLNWCKLGDAGDITLENIRQYRLYLNRLKDEKGRELKKATQAYHIIALRSFLRYLNKIGTKTLSPEKIELPKTEPREVSFLEREEIERLLAVTNDPKNSLKSLRDRAIFETLFSTGLRISELIRLDKEDIDLARGELTVRGKGNKIRLVFLSDEAKGAIKKYLDSRTDLEEALFIPIRITYQEEKRLTPRSIQRLIKYYAAKAGIVGKKITPHTIRHTFGTDLLRNGADIRSVQTLMGHSSITTTQIYTHVTDKQLREIHKKFHRKKE